MRITSGSLRNRKLLAPKGVSTRPTLEIVRKSIFDALGPDFTYSTFLDIFAGSGAMSFEALSRGFSHAYLIENSFLAASCIRKNALSLELQNSYTLYKKDALKHIPKLKNKQFDIIFIDPPYSIASSENSCIKLSVQTLLCVDKANILAPKGILFLETSKNALEDAFHTELSFSNLQFVKKRSIGETVIYTFENKP
ncbi:16S rRNA (guanine(966)-N(2))-methyltransferase RsmD [Candidatus Aerophobetes bacterium]|uniref:16S rRNA (Guanine(966)-N(2))-methyltransferase RsmD n=1 Tax=Aerophobetes bacterium TaxID=2030807 RepID=A0A2A4X6H8_UNCAE|nr:MAG: 16S rRNA (guanine(966)-N(2))-methyltransferase RsmD [Candidatus Aerophobetes bacterium]